EVLDELETLAKKSYVSPARLALIHVGLGDKDKAFALLEKAFDAKSDAMPFLLVEPRFDGLHSDRRFKDLGKRVGLGQGVSAASQKRRRPQRFCEASLNLPAQCKGPMMPSDTLQEVTQVAVIRHPRQGVLLLHSAARQWHFPDSTVKVHE